MDAIRWIGLGLAVLGALAAIGRVFWVGQARLKAVEDASAKHFKQSEEHYSHEADDDKHWTKRERDALTASLKDISDDVKAIRKNGQR